MKALMIVAQKGYQPNEYGIPKKILENAGIEVVTASKQVGTCQSTGETTTEATISIDDINVSDYDAIIFVGGPGAVDYQNDVNAHLTCQEAINRKKILAAICIAPTILANADVLEGKKATVWNEDGKQAEVLTKNKAEFVDEEVVVDGKVITANGPEAAEMFGKKIIEMLN
jgi:protease I